MLFIIGFGYSFVSITNWAVVADVIDYQEYKTGIKNESAVYAVYTFCRKLGQTAADYGGLMLLGKVGYDVQLMSNAGYVDGVSEGILQNLHTDSRNNLYSYIPALSVRISAFEKQA